MKLSVEEGRFATVKVEAIGGRERSAVCSLQSSHKILRTSETEQHRRTQGSLPSSK